MTATNREVTVATLSAAHRTKRRLALDQNDEGRGLKDSQPGEVNYEDEGQVNPARLLGLSLLGLLV